MSGDDARPPGHGLRTVRDAILLLVVTVALLAGLIHYADRLGGQEDPGAPSRAVPVAASSAASGTARLDSAPPADPVATPAAVTCWDGRAVTSLSMCTLPSGSAGLRWVYPSLAADPSCRRVTRTAGYETVLAWRCSATMIGRPVVITYEQVASTAAAGRAIERAFADGRRFVIPGAHGGRGTWFDATRRPVRVAGEYEHFPYVVSLYAPTPQAAKQAWATLVRQRSPRAIRGLPA